jgi:hypothetical protein
MNDLSLFATALCVTVGARDFAAAAAMLNHRSQTGDWFSLGVEESDHPCTIRWEIWDRQHSRIWLNDSLERTPRKLFVISRLVSILPLLAAYRSYDGFSVGNLLVNLDDIGNIPGLAFSDSRPEYFLIPDAVFVQHEGYANMRLHAVATTVAWDRRQPIGFWRGGTSGSPTDPALGWRSLPRVKLCEISQEHPDILDAGITHVAQMSDESERELRDTGIIRSYVPVAQFAKFKYQIDIDGNTNSWPGLFQKLLTGSPVLKIASSRGYRQWYYDRLRPWINFVPVASDMSDLVEKTAWLLEHDDTARRIGANGQALAMSLSYEAELTNAGRTIAAAARYFAVQAETELRFGPDTPGDVRLLDGWTTPREGGLPATGYESRFELPRPIAAESFILTLDLSPVVEDPAAPAQRVVVVVNGEVLREAVLAARQQLCCRVPRRTIEGADRLRVTLLHPDGACLASPSHPLDERVWSITLHGLTLTPASVHAKLGGAGSEVFPPDPAQPRHEPIQDVLHGPDLWLPTDAKWGRVKTHWGTVIFADADRGVLRHGPEESVPNNLQMGENRGVAYLFHIVPHGRRYTVRIPPAAQNSDKISTLDACAARYQVFRILPVGADERFGLQSGGLLLCAEADGRVTLSRSGLGPWERFAFLPLRGAT